MRTIATVRVRDTVTYALLNVKQSFIELMGEWSDIAEAMRNHDEWDAVKYPIQFYLDNPDYILSVEDLNDVIAEGKHPEQFVTEECFLIC